MSIFFHYNDIREQAYLTTKRKQEVKKRKRRGERVRLNTPTRM